ncbi:MAG: hypothetical protein ACM3SQ_17095, partial [Betaproteobacteria bacterium]
MPPTICVLVNVTGPILIGVSAAFSGCSHRRQDGRSAAMRAPHDAQVTKAGVAMAAGATFPHVRRGPAPAAN